MLHTHASHSTALSSRTRLRTRASRGICFFLITGAILYAAATSLLQGAPPDAPERPRIQSIALVRFIVTSTEASRPFY